MALVEGMDHVLPREPKPLGEALGRALEADGIELYLGEHANARPPSTATSTCSSSPGATTCAATACSWRPAGAPASTASAWTPSAWSPRDRAIPVDERMRVADGVWAIGDATGIWPLTYMGKYQGRVAAANILGRDRTANYDAVPRVVFTDPQAASVGEPRRGR